MEWIKRVSSETKIAIIAVLVIAGAVVAVIVLAGGSGGKSAASEGPHMTAQEGREAEEEVFGNPKNPMEPRNLNEVVIAHPKDEEATAAQLQRQIITNEESSDPTHKQEASCGYLSEYGHYISYHCFGYALGTQSSALGELEVTVNTDTGEVLVEEE